jgi:hypothetical protein
MWPVGLAGDPTSRLRCAEALDHVAVLELGLRESGCSAAFMTGLPAGGLTRRR